MVLHMFSSNAFTSLAYGRGEEKEEAEEKIEGRQRKRRRRSLKKMKIISKKMKIISRSEDQFPFSSMSL
jgi:hypothetical protein